MLDKDTKRTLEELAIAVELVEKSTTVFQEVNKKLEYLPRAQEELAEFSKKYFDSPYNAGALLMLDDIINPRDTRPILIDALEITAKKEVVRPEKRKHGNIPL